MFSRIRLAIYVVVGAILGNVAVGFVSLAAHFPPGLKTILLLAGYLVGGCFGWLICRGRANAITSDVHGSAYFGSDAEAKRGLGGEGLIVGRAERKWLMRYGGPAHLLTIAPTRSGKGVGAVIPNLLVADRAVLCIDPKGENALVTYQARSKFGAVHLLDPFEACGLPGACYNPMAHLDIDSLDVGEEAALIADALVHDPPQQISDAHWNEEAKALLVGLILHAAASPYAVRRNLAHVREVLTSPQQRFELELRAMQASPAARGLVARAANRHLSKADREAAGVLSAAQRHTHFLDSPRMARLLSGSDFTIDVLREGAATVFLVLPPDRLSTHARWLRLMVAQALDRLAKAKPPAGMPPVLFLLDEFAALGRLESVERAFGLMAGYGIQLWPILQDIHQLRGAYGHVAGTFMSNAGVIQIFNVADIETAGWVSRTLGSTTEAYFTSGTSVTQSPDRWRATRGVSENLNLTQRDLMTPDEVLRMDPDKLLVLRPGEAPIAATKVRYFADSEFRGLFAERASNISDQPASNLEARPRE